MSSSNTSKEESGSNEETTVEQNESKTKVYSLEEVGKHATSDDMWMVIHNKVYDVTTFLDEHPGGVEVLLENAGLEATYAFEDVGHSLDARELLDQYYIAELHKDDQTKTPSDDAQITVNDGSDSNMNTGILFGIGAAVVAALSFYLFNRT